MIPLLPNEAADRINLVVCITKQEVEGDEMR